MSVLNRISKEKQNIPKKAWLIDAYAAPFQ